MRCANCFTSGDEAFCAASWPSCTSAMPSCAAVSTNLRSLEESALEPVLVPAGVLVLPEDVLLPAPAAVVPVGPERLPAVPPAPDVLPVADVPAPDPEPDVCAAAESAKPIEISAAASAVLPEMRCDMEPPTNVR